jgi:hypothetical protein
LNPCRLGSLRERKGASPYASLEVGCSRREIVDDRTGALITYEIYISELLKWTGNSSERDSDKNKMEMNYR